eukprot:TRINITY_DN11594_c0_g1_i1.p1 TRINITY_DN11594_c0_g1~~TRINITY_DN11594_c0_g1_i1.p1  ORF type:complete len:434 (+),score=62.34 TRINITY_DN11594_c0_g1_i1:76-1377(+)
MLLSRCLLPLVYSSRISSVESAIPILIRSISSKSVFALKSLSGVSVPSPQSSFHGNPGIPTSDYPSTKRRLHASFLLMTAELGQASSIEEQVTGVKRKMPKSVGTHNGTFHCDEALACYMLRLTDAFNDAAIVRTRDPKVLDTLDAVLDVGGVYDAEKFRFDHHQRTFSESFGHGFVTKLSTAGLVYKHFGREIVSKELKLPLDHPDVEKLYLTLYRTFVEAIDGIDNGVNQYDTDAPQRYESSTHLSARVGHLNPDWQEDEAAAANGTGPAREDEQFHKAMELAGGEFIERLRHLAHSWLPARSIVAASLSARHEADPSGEIVVLQRYCPWKSHLDELEQELKVDPLPKYILYEDGRSHQWRIQAMSVAPGKFESRKALPVAWRGLRDDELSELSGIPGCVFCHASGFIGGNKTFEGALKMAKEALRIPLTN